jgi:hypothetical protein
LKIEESLTAYHKYSFFSLHFSIKKALTPLFARGQALFAVSDIATLVMVGALALGRVINRFNDAVGHPHSQDRQRVPQAAHEQHVPCIPNPFKMKWKHYLPPLSVERFKVHRSALS